MRLYVINLASREDRLQHITSELKRVGAAFERLEAVDARTSPEVLALEQRPSSRSGFVISDAALACALSHMKAWRVLLESGESHCAVVEDDVLVSEDFVSSLSTGWLPAGADIVRLETYRTRVHLAARPSAFLGERGVYRMLTRQAGTAAYIVSRQAAAKLLKFMTPPTDAVDEVMFNDRYGWMPQARVYQVSPAMAVQADRAPEVRFKTAGFAVGSIAAREEDEKQRNMEMPSARLIRRLRNEILARKLRSSYSVVPFER